MRAGAAADRRRGARARDRARAGRGQHRAPVGRDRDPVRGRAAAARARRRPLRGAPASHVLAGEGWHPGVIGIVASRLVERYHRPFVLVALDGDGRGRGSGRSIAAYDLHAGLVGVRRASDRASAATGWRPGWRSRPTAWSASGRAGRARRRALTRPRTSCRSERVDAVVPGDALGLELAEELERLRPFGMGNPGVNLLVPAARVSDVQPMGEGRHVALHRHVGRRSLACGRRSASAPRRRPVLRTRSAAA